MSQAELAEALADAGFQRAYGVPDSGLATLIRELRERLPVHDLPREDLAVAAAAGAYLGGEDAVVFMKNAGLGTSIDALLSLARASGVPISTVIGMSGTGHDRLAHHVVVGERTTALLEATGLGFRVLAPDSTPRRLARWLHHERTSGASAAILIPPPEQRH